MAWTVLVVVGIAVVVVACWRVYNSPRGVQDRRKREYQKAYRREYRRAAGSTEERHESATYFAQEHVGRMVDKGLL